MKWRAPVVLTFNLLSKHEYITWFTDVSCVWKWMSWKWDMVKPGVLHPWPHFCSVKLQFANGGGVKPPLICHRRSPRYVCLSEGHHFVSLLSFQHSHPEIGLQNCTAQYNTPKLQKSLTMEIGHYTHCKQATCLLISKLN